MKGDLIMRTKEAVLAAARQGAKKYAGEQLELLRRLSEIDHGTGNIEGNRQVIQQMDALFATMDIAVEYPENPGRGRHVVARIKPERSTGKVIINSHLDTVFKPGDAAAHPFRIEGDIAYGLGIADCLGGFVVSCYAVKIMQQAGMLPDKEIVMIYNSDEEIGSPSGRSIFQQEAKDAQMAFVFEPAREENGILTYRKGVAACKLEVFGKEAHAGLKYTEGRSATVELAHQILALNAMNDPKTEKFYNVGPLTGGKGAGIVAGHASADIMISLADNDSFSQVCADMERLEKNIMVDGCTVKASADMIFPPMEHTAGNVSVYEIVHEVGLQMGVDYPEQFSAGSSDACYFTTYGVPTVDGLGPYMYDIHTFNERLVISSIQQKTQLFAVVLGNL